MDESRSVIRALRTEYRVPISNFTPMDHKYIVKYLDSQILSRDDEWKRKGNMDGLNTSNDLEALILEQSGKGYDLVSITPVNGIAVKSPYSINTTIGFMVTFKKE